MGCSQIDESVIDELTFDDLTWRRLALHLSPLVGEAIFFYVKSILSFELPKQNHVDNFGPKHIFGLDGNSRSEVNCETATTVNFYSQSFSLENFAWHSQCQEEMAASAFYV